MHQYIITITNIIDHHCIHLYTELSEEMPDTATQVRNILTIIGQFIFTIKGFDVHKKNNT